MYEPVFPLAAQEFYEICKNNDTALTFQDILLEPGFSDIESRSSISLSSWVTPLRQLRIPLIAANMDTICEAKMAIAMGLLGGMGVIHRYMDYDRQVIEVAKTAKIIDTPIAAAIGVKNGAVEQSIKLVAAGADIIVIDIAHGHHKMVLDLLKTLKSLELKSEDGLPVEYIAGNVATGEGTSALFSAGADTVKVGIGAGSICSTRTVTGHGMPQLLAIASSALTAFSYKKPIIADGGVKNSGDIVKALAGGANIVMTGYLFAGTDETPGSDYYDSKWYRGMASSEAQKEFYGNYPAAPEGVNVRVPSNGSVGSVINGLIAGLKSGFSYSGAKDLNSLRHQASFVRISHNANLEALTLAD